MACAINGGYNSGCRNISIEEVFNNAFKDKIYDELIDSGTIYSDEENKLHIQLWKLIEYMILNESIMQYIETYKKNS